MRQLVVELEGHMHYHPINWGCVVLEREMVNC